MALVVTQKGRYIIYTGTPDEVLTAIDSNPYPMKVISMSSGTGQLVVILCWEHRELTK